MKPWIRLFAVLAALVAAPALAQLNLGASSGELLEPEKAFQFSARALGADAVQVSFKIADGYYMYRDKFRFGLEGSSGAKLGAPEFPAGIRKKDEFFGEIETYRKAVSIRIPVERASPAATTLLLKVTSQHRHSDWPGLPDARHRPPNSHVPGDRRSDALADHPGIGVGSADGRTG